MACNMYCTTTYPVRRFAMMSLKLNTASHQAFKPARGVIFGSSPREVSLVSEFVEWTLYSDSMWSPANVLVVSCYFVSEKCSAEQSLLAGLKSRNDSQEIKRTNKTHSPRT